MRETTKQPKFEAGEKVLCFHGPLLYKAKCLEHRLKDSKYEYYVHYDGWNKSWDEWVPEARVEKVTDMNLTQMKALQKAHKMNKSMKGKKSKTKTGRDGKSTDTGADSDSRPSTPVADPKKRILGEKRKGSPTPSESGSDAPKRNKRLKPDHAVETEEQFLDRVEVKVTIPPELKTWLANDSVWIVKKKKLVSMPAKLNVDKILSMYYDSKKASQTKAGDGKLACCSIVCDGIKEYFNTMLEAKLLYKEEQGQFNKLKAEYPDKKASQIYGCHHLLRLFAKIGASLAYTQLNEKSLCFTLAALHDFLRYISNHVNLFLDSKNYE